MVIILKNILNNYITYNIGAKTRPEWIIPDMYWGGIKNESDAY